MHSTRSQLGKLLICALVATGCIHRTYVIQPAPAAGSAPTVVAEPPGFTAPATSGPSNGAWTLDPMPDPAAVVPPSAPAAPVVSAPVVSAPAARSYADAYRGPREFLLARKAIDGPFITNRAGLTFAGQPYKGQFTPVELTADGGAYVAYNVRLDENVFSPHVVRLDATGAVRWTAALPGKSRYDTYEVQGVLATADGGTLVVVCPFRGHNPEPYFVHKVTTHGEIAWTLQLPRYGGDGPFLFYATLNASYQLEVRGNYQTVRSEDKPLEEWAGVVSTDGKLIESRRVGELDFDIIGRPNMDPSWLPVD